MPTFGNAAERTALPQPPKTSQNVPNISAAARFPIGIVVSSDVLVQTFECSSNRRDARGYETPRQAPRSTLLDLLEVRHLLEGSKVDGPLHEDGRHSDALNVR